ncbi:centromere protein H [Gastrophryne carolinensis]
MAEGNFSPQKLDHIPEILVQLRDVSAKCLKSSLPNTKVGPEDTQESINGAKSYMQLIGLRKHLKQQLQDMKTDSLTRVMLEKHWAGGTFRENIDSSFNVSLSAALDPLVDEMCSFKNKELALHRMQTFNALLTSLRMDPSQHPSVLAVMRHYVDNSKQILAIQLTNREIEAQLISIRKTRTEIRIRQQDLFRKLKYSGKTCHKIRDTEMKAHLKEQKSLEKLSNQVVILQEVFQRCVLSAKLDWAEDPYLKSLLMRMNDPHMP